MKTSLFIYLLFMSINIHAQSISGTIYDDGNGLKDSTVNGIAGNMGLPLYATLFNGLGYIEKTIPVADNGTYSFTALVPGSYFIVLNNDPLGPLYATLPQDWVHTGENIGIAKGSDGNANGRIDLVLGSQPITNVNFGINKKPVAFNITLSRGIENPGGSLKVQVPRLYVADLEDGTVPIIINNLPSSGTLYYNSKLVKAGDTLYPYDESKFFVDPYAGNIIITFGYSTIDNAGYQSNIASVTMPFGIDINIVPVELSFFEVTKKGPKEVQLNWETDSELNSLSFTVYRSKDGASWEELYTLPAAGTSNIKHSYTYTDMSPYPGRTLYRLKMTDIDGSFIYTSVRWVYISPQEYAGGIDIFPNPVTNYISVRGIYNPCTIKLFDMSGRLLYSKKTTYIGHEIFVGHLAAGIYQVIVISEDGTMLWKEKVSKQ